LYGELYLYFISGSINPFTVSVDSLFQIYVKLYATRSYTNAYRTYRPVENNLLQSMAVGTERSALCVSFGQLVSCYLTRSTGTLLCRTVLIALDSDVLR